MSFRSPQWLWLLAALPLVLPFLIARERKRTAIARRFVSERLRGLANPLRALRPYIVTLALAGLSVALAGPFAGFTTVEVTTREANRVIVIDVSQSMAAEDIGTSRLAASKALARRLVAHHNGRAGVIAFEGTADVISPLTNDADALLALLDTLEPGEVGNPGSDIGGAILLAMKLIDADRSQKADIVIISDGEEQGRRIDEAIGRARQRGVPISAVVVGSSEGSTIPAHDGVLKDQSGEVVVTYARSDVLQRLARGTGGTLLENPFSEHEIEPLMTRRAGGAARTTQVRVPTDRYQWPLALAFAAFFCASLLNRGAE